jgi:hypothetical protein
MEDGMNDAVTRQVQALAADCAQSGIPVLQVVYGFGSMSLLAFDHAGRLDLASGPELYEQLYELELLLRPEDETRPLVVEVRIDRSGSYEFRHTFELDSSSPAEPPAQLVLDPDYRYPNHPPPGMAPPPEATVSERPTDPVALATVRALVDEFTTRYTAVKGRPPEFDAGYSEEEILAAENAIGMRLPEDVRALYRTIHDDIHEHGLLGAQSLLPMEKVTE